MSVSVVNGYVCTSCDDVAKARRGENPARADRPGEGPPGRLAAADEARASGESPAVVLGGTLAASATGAVAGERPKDTPADPARRLDLRI